MAMEARSFEERSGKLSELFLFGRVKVDNPDYVKGLKECLTKNGDDRISCSFGLVKQFQPFDPTNPQKPFLRDLRKSFSDELGFKEEKYRSMVKIFTGVDSIVDREFGTDAFMEVTGSDGKATILTFDGSINPKKDHTKADILVDEIPAPEEFPEDYKIKVQDIAKLAVKTYQSKLSGQYR